MLSPLRLALVVVSSVHLSHLVGGLVLPGTSRRHVVGRWASTGSRSAVRRSAWQAVQDDTGRTYYWDEESGSTQWERPEGFNDGSPAAAAAAAAATAAAEPAAVSDSSDSSGSGGGGGGGGGGELSLDDARLYQVSLPPSTGIQWGADLALRWPRVLGFEEGSGADVAGVAEGDQLVAIGGRSVAG